MTRRHFLKQMGVLSLVMIVGPGRYHLPAAAAQAATPAAEWPMFRRDLQHTGRTDGHGQIRGPNVKWRFGTRGAVEPSAAVGDIDGDGKVEVVIGSFDGLVYAINGAMQGTSTTPKWSFQTETSENKKALVWSSPALGDVDGDGKIEVVAGADDGNVYVLNGANGQEKWRYITRENVRASPTLADIDGDGRLEIVIASNQIYALDARGRRAKWIYPLQTTNFSSAAVGDIDGDGRLEVVVGSDDGNVYVLNGADGQEKWRYVTRENVRASPTLADIDGDGRLEIIVASNQIYALDARARRAKWTYPLQTTNFSSAAVGDIDGDGKLEVVVGSYDNYLFALSGPTGALKWKFYAGNQVESSPALGDIDGDGKIEVVFGQGFISGERPKGIYALRGSDGGQKWFFNIGDDKRVISSPALGDVDGDGKIEVVIGSNVNRLYVFNGQGQVKYTHDAQYFIESSPALGDIDGDGKIEIVVGSHDFKLYSLEVAPGQQQLRVEWTYTPPAANIFFSSPTLADIDGDGLLEIVIGNNNDEVYAIDSA